MKPLIVILHNIRSTYNVGAILRTCDCLGINSVIFSGYTPFIDKGLPYEREKLKKQIHKTALGAEDFLVWNRFDDIHAAVKHFRDQGFTIYALEQGPASLNLAESQSFADKAVLILGEEVHGVPQDVLDECDQLLEIPMAGQKESFNVSVATGIALWELRKPDLNDKRTHLRTPE